MDTCSGKSLDAPFGIESETTRQAKTVGSGDHLVDTCSGKSPDVPYGMESEITEQGKTVAAVDTRRNLLQTCSLNGMKLGQ